jgi:glycosyltransferase involved in cell wall biosynthesis
MPGAPAGHDARVRVLIFHGYLLRGTGSNVYNARLAAALGRQGHEVHLLSQEHEPSALDLGPNVHTHRPDIGAILPVYVADRYEGFEARTFLELSDAQIEDYVARNVEAVRALAARVAFDVALANHLVMGPLIVARGLAGRVPYAVKIHGSALEYVVKRDPARFLPAAREGLAGARTILVGSRHTAESLWAAVDEPSLPARTRLGPPGVDVEAFRPRDPGEAAAGMASLARHLAAEADAAPPATGEPRSAFDRDPREAARAIARLGPGDRLVVFVGKLIVAKGIDLLLAAWPLVLAAVPDARLVVVGFGGDRDRVQRLLAALHDRDLACVGAEAAAVPRLAHLAAFLEELGAGPDAEAYRAAAARLDERVVLTGRLEHHELAPLLAAAEAEVVPSTFPEAFGMVAAEAAACGALPIVARHSGLAEVAATLEAVVEPEVAELLTFPVGPRAVRDLAERIIAWLEAPAPLREATRSAIADVARRRFSWDGVAEQVLTAAKGGPAALPEP